MYTQGMNVRILRNMGGEGGGAAAPAAAPAAGSAPAASDNGGASAPQYVSKQDFDSFSSNFRRELQESLSRFNQPKPESRGQGEPGEPDPSKYDFTKPGELSRYNADLRKHFRHLDKQEEAAERAKSEGENRSKETLQGHRARMKDYFKDNPTAEEEIRKSGAVEVLEQVKMAVYASKNSPAIVHYLAKNKAVAQELDEILETEGIESVRERIGEIHATIKAEKQIAEATAKAAADRPPRQSFRGNSGSATKQLSAEERYARFHK